MRLAPCYTSRQVQRRAQGYIPDRLVVGEAWRGEAVVLFQSDGLLSCCGSALWRTLQSLVHQAYAQSALGARA